MDFLIIFILCLFGFWRYRVERQAEIRQELFERERRKYGRL